MNDADHRIIERVLQGNTNDFSILVEKYQSVVYNLVYHMLWKNHDLAEEIAQESFVRIFEKLHQFKFDKKFFSWMYRIAINTAIDCRRAEGRYLRPELFPQAAAGNAEHKMAAKEKSQLLRNAMDALKEKYRMVIFLKYYEQLSYTEIAEVLGISEKKVKSRLFDARVMMKEYLDKKDFF